MHSLDTLLLGLSFLIIISILIAKASRNVGVPVLLLFLAVGMLAGSEGPGGIYFDDAGLAQSIGIIALVIILFSGGLDTHWHETKPVLRPATLLATIGVVLTTLLIGVFLHFVFQFQWLYSLLIGAIVSSTDAAAVFSILAFRRLNLKGNTKALLELESGTNDPMAVFLTITLTSMVMGHAESTWMFAWHFVREMGLGAAMGLGLGWLLAKGLNKLKLPLEGFYPVFVLAAGLFIYALTTLMHGSGFLAVYLAGLVVGNSNVVYKKTILRFFDGNAWLAQIIMFITLGLLVYPSQLLPIYLVGISLSAFLIFVARPMGVFLSLIGSSFQIKEKVLISWVGLRGAVPIILATFPLLAGVPYANNIFNIVFFVVCTSALLQGWSTPTVAEWLGLSLPPKDKMTSPVEYSHSHGTDIKMIELRVPAHPHFDGKSIVEIAELKGSLVVTVQREGKYIVPTGHTVLQYGDTLQVLTERDKVDSLKEVMG